MFSLVEIKKMWLEDKNARRLSNELIESQIDQLPVERLNQIFTTGIVQDIESLRWFVEKLINKNLELEETLREIQNKHIPKCGDMP